MLHAGAQFCLKMRIPRYSPICGKAGEGRTFFFGCGGRPGVFFLAAEAWRILCWLQGLRLTHWLALRRRRRHDKKTSRQKTKHTGSLPTRVPSAEWEAFHNTLDPSSGWQNCDIRNDFPVLATTTCLTPTSQVFLVIKDTSVPAVQNLMPWRAPIQSRRGTQQSTQHSSPFHIVFLKLMLVNLPMRYPKTGYLTD